jgi:hypothetical protein
MATNQYGEKLDRNGYAPSLFLGEEGECWLCHRQGPTERHECFGAALRSKSKELGLWVNLCGSCHRTGKNAVHQSEKTAKRIKNMAQRIAMTRYGWTEEEFINHFYKSFLED